MKKFILSLIVILTYPAVKDLIYKRVHNALHVAPASPTETQYNKKLRTTYGPGMKDLLPKAVAESEQN